LLLNFLILWRRLCLGLYPGLIALGLWHRLFFLGIPAIFLVNLMAVNPMQIWANVDLFARLMVLDRLMNEDDDLRKRVLGE